MPRRFPSLLLGLLVLTAGCIDPVEPEPVVDPPIDSVAFDPALGINLGAFLADPSGIWIRDDEEGLGEAVDYGQRVDIYFTGWASNGSLFERREAEDGATAQFILGNPGPIGGMTLGVAGMRVGGQRTVLVPPSLGFGRADFLPQVPPNSWLVLRIRLVAIDGAGGG